MNCHRCNKNALAMMQIKIQYKPSTTGQKLYRKPFDVVLCHECLEQLYKTAIEFPSLAKKDSHD